MAVPIKKQCDGYSYVVPFCGIDNESIAESREVFASYKSRGVIILGDYDDPKWTMTDEVRKQVTIDFTFSEVHNCLNDLEVSHQMAQKALRVFATSMFGFSLLKIRADVDAAKRFLSNKTIPDDAGQAFAILRILDLLPTDTAFSEEMTDALQATMDSSDPGHRQQRSLGFLETYLRFDDLMKDFWSTASKQDNGHSWKASPNNRSTNTGCPYCKNHKLIPTENSLLVVNPDLAKQWDHERNTPVTAADVTAFNNNTFWWICNEGHRWMATVSNRSKGEGCPYCSGRKAIPGVNSFDVYYPEIAGEWHPSKNGSMLPSDFSLGSNKIVWWRCGKGHEWQATIFDRVNGSECPKCKGAKDSTRKLVK